MKQILVITLLLLMASIPGIAANSELCIGIHQSRFSGKDLPGKKIAGIPGFSIGGALHWPVNSVLSVQSGLNLHTKGCRINTVGDIYLNNIFVYIESPILFEFNLNRVNPDLYLICGTSVNLNILAINDVGLIDEIRKLDMAFVAGIGLNLKRGSITLQANQGLLPFDLSKQKTDLRHQAVGAVIAIKF